MKRKPRRKIANDQEDEGNDSICYLPIKGKENVSPFVHGRPSLDSQHHQLTTLLNDFDQNGKLVSLTDLIPLIMKKNSLVHITI